ncbi:MAG: hypothetical protein ACYCZJ_13915 [Sulfuriferula sp.]
MSEAWKHLDLEGEGLQSANLRLVQLMKRRPKAYALLALFPLGLHRSYLEEVRGAWIYRIASIVALITWWFGANWAALLIIVLLVGFAAYDIRWIEDRVATLNKALRIQIYKSKRSTAAPKGFRGRYTDDDLDDYLKVKEQERGGHVLPGTDSALNNRSRAPSFAEQEAMLKALAKSKRNNKSQ